MYTDNEKAEENFKHLVKIFKENKEKLMQMLCSYTNDSSDCNSISDEELAKYGTSVSLIRDFIHIEEKAHNDAIAVFTGIKDQLKNADENIDEQILSWYNDNRNDVKRRDPNSNVLIESLKQTTSMLFSDITDQIKDMVKSVFVDSYYCAINAIQKDKLSVSGKGGGELNG